MRLLSLFSVALLLAGCSQAPLAKTAYLSTGCQNLNDPFYDDTYLSGNVYFSPFYEGESVTLSLADLNIATEIYLIVTDTTGTTPEDLVIGRVESAEPLSYTFSQDYDQTAVYWSADVGVPTWEVLCR